VFSKQWFYLSGFTLIKKIFKWDAEKLKGRKGDMVCNKVTGEVKTYTEQVKASESRSTSDKPGFKSKER